MSELQVSMGTNGAPASVVDPAPLVFVSAEPLQCFAEPSKSCLTDSGGAQV